MSDPLAPRPVGGTHVRTGCQSCGGAWQRFDDKLVETRFGDRNPYEWLCYTCLDLTWGEGVGDYEN